MCIRDRANRLFGFTAKQTLDYAQQLYEKKLLTYPQMCIRDSIKAASNEMSVRSLMAVHLLP